MLSRIGCPPKLLKLIESFHTNMKGTIHENGFSSDTYDIRCGVKQGCVLAPTLFGIFFALLIKHAFKDNPSGIYLRTRSTGKLFNLSRLKAKTKVREVVIREMLFADDAALTAHSQEELQSLMNCFASACRDFGLTISLSKTKVLGQGVASAPEITVENCQLEVVHEFTYLGSTVSDSLSLDNEINQRTGQRLSCLHASNTESE